MLPEEDISLRPLAKGEREQFIQWAERNRERNHWDASLLKYPLLAVMAAQVGSRPLLYMPVHPVLMMDSLAPAPDITAPEFRDALLRLFAAAEQTAREAGMGEVIFFATEPAIERAAVRLGFERSAMLVMRKRLANHD